MKFPQTISHRDGKAVIYARSKAYPFYRVCWRSNGRRLMKSFGSYGEAHEEAGRKAREVAKGSQAASLTAAQAADAITALETLEAFRRETGKVESLKSAVGQFCEVAGMLHNVPLRSAVEGYIANTADIKPKPLAEAVEAFLKIREIKTRAKNGKRPELDPKYHSNVSTWLRGLRDTFPGHLVSDIGRDHLEAWMDSCAELSAKSRNDRRAAVKMFLRWCSRNEYLARNTCERLLECDALKAQRAEDGEIDFYRPDELRALLEHAVGPMRAVIALQGLAGLRLTEVFRLTWSDVFGTPGHVEISSSKSKTRQRRLVEIVPALEQWLAPFRGEKGRVCGQWETVNGYVQAFAPLRERAKVPSRRNGLRHGFCTYHFALRQDEGLTAAQAGHSPRMLFANYNGRATKTEAEKWFSVKPTGSAGNVIPLPTNPPKRSELR